MAARRHERTHARWCALQALYAAEMCGKKPHEVIDEGGCLYTGDVYEELSQAVADAEATWNLRYRAWREQLEQGDTEAKEPVFEDIDMSGYACVAPLPDYALLLVNGVDERCAAIDRRLGEVSSNWSVERMPVADRCILRIAVYEMFCAEETPISVAINEAVDLAKFFGGQDESPQFINGVLGNIACGIEAGGERAVLTDPVAPVPRFGFGLASEDDESADSSAAGAAFADGANDAAVVNDAAVANGANDADDNGTSGEAWRL